MAAHWKYWRDELASPGSQDRQTTDPGNGFWRYTAAKTKPDWPVAIWYEPEQQGGEPTIPVVKVGNSVTRGEDALLEFLSGSTWLRTVAVSHEDYSRAMETGKWPDGKPARHMDDAERHDINIEPGGNAAPVEETIADQIKEAVAKANAIKTVGTPEEAQRANELADKLAALFKAGDAKRAEEKRPHDDAAKAVQAKWLPIITPASDARERLVGKGGLVKQWLKAEQARIDEEARQARIAAQAEAARVRQENEKAAAEAADKGEAAPAPIPAPEPPPAAEPQRARAGSTFGRATGLRKLTRAKITDIGKLLQALSTHKEMIEFAQTLANRAAKAGIPLDGMEIEEVME